MEDSIPDNLLSSFDRNRPIEQGLGYFFLNEAPYSISQKQRKTAHDLIRIRSELIALCSLTKNIPSNVVPVSDDLFWIRQSLDGIENIVYDHEQNPPDKGKLQKEAASIAKNIKHTAQLLTNADKYLTRSLFFFGGHNYRVTQTPTFGEPNNYNMLDGIHALLNHVASHMEDIPNKLKYKYRDEALMRINFLYAELTGEMPKRETSYKDAKKTQPSGRTFEFVKNAAKILRLDSITDSVIDESIRKAQPRYRHNKELQEAISSFQITTK